MLSGDRSVSASFLESRAWQPNNMTKTGPMTVHPTCCLYSFFFFFFFSLFFPCMFSQLFRVQHSCSSTQSWGNVLPSIVEMRDQNSRGRPLLFLRFFFYNLFVHSGQKSDTPTAIGKLWMSPGVRCIKHALS